MDPKDATRRTEARTPAAPAFEPDNLDARPFGTFRPSRALRGVLGVTRLLPNRWWGQTLSSVCRRLSRSAPRGPVDVEVYSFRMRLHPGDNLCEKRMLYGPQNFDRLEREFLQKTLSSGATFVDVGANVGVYSLVAATACGDNARIVAVEPDPYIRRRLQFNVLASEFSSIHVDGAAVSDRRGEVELHLNATNRGGNNIVTPSGESITVRTVTLRELLDRHAIHCPDCIKLDIEGAEYVVLRQFFEDVDESRHPRSIILEQYHDQALSDAADLVLQQGYRILQRTRMNLILQKQ